MGKVRFNFSLANQTGDIENGSSLKSAPGFDQARTVVLSIEKKNGDATDYASTKVDMNNMTDDFFSQNLPLGEYKLTECLILDNEDTAIYAIPVAGSNQAQNVGNPLSIDFSVSKDQQTNVPLEIVSTYRSTPADFGLTRFSWTPIITFPLIINVIEKGQAGNFLTASLTVSKDTYSKTEELSANMVNYLTIKDGFDDYTLTISKPGFITYTTKILRNDLRRYEANPLSIELERDNGSVGTITSPITGRIWMDRNLGASRVATGPYDELAYGDLYQWGRPADGHEKRTSETTLILSSTDVPGHANFIIPSLTGSYSYGAYWRSNPINNLWDGVDGINNPCPDGFRIPTEQEWEAEPGLQAIYGPLNEETISYLKLTYAGSRSYFSGEISQVGEDGNYWCAIQDRPDSRSLLGIDVPEFMRPTAISGHSVRCIKD